MVVCRSPFSATPNCVNGSLFVCGRVYSYLGSVEACVYSSVAYVTHSGCSLYFLRLCDDSRQPVIGAITERADWFIAVHSAGLKHTELRGTLDCSCVL